MSAPDVHAARGVDPRAPRFGAALTSALLIVVIFLGLTGRPAASPGTTSLGERAADPAFLLLAAVAALFAWGALLGVRRHPWGLLYRRFVRPRLGPPGELEDPRPPTFAQGVGLVVAAAGLALQLAGVPYGLAAAATAAFLAAFLNAAFGYCLGCQLHALLARWRPARA